jgi:hypothetical protein
VCIGGRPLDVADFETATDMPQQEKWIIDGPGMELRPEDPLDQRPGAATYGLSLRGSA